MTSFVSTMTALLKIVALVAVGLLGVAHAQIKTSGIKGHHPAMNLMVNNTNEYHASSGGSSYSGGFSGGNSYNLYQSGNFVAATNYEGGAFPKYPTRAPVILDPVAQFINKTRSAMASGVCYTEVPTSSLVRGGSSAVPAGNGTTEGMSKIQICCDGYERNPHVFARCDPVCADDCPNGICTAPNTCVCIPGHIRNELGKCITTCPIGCGNGVCDDNGVCQCKPGYVLEPVNGKYCVPHCEPGCQFGQCVAPNKCDCQEGYRATAGGVCEPKCDNCDNGKCSSPGVCTCNQGYLKLEGGCEPICTSGCEKGRCIAPNTCECSKGFILDRSGSKCTPHCDQPCMNGVCEGHNTCTCNTGYVLDDYQKSLCRPHCPHGCPDGYCTAPNFCVCKPGYIKSGVKGRQTCIPV